GESTRSTRGHDHIRLDPDQIGDQLGEPTVPPVGPPVLDDDVSTLDVAELAEALAKRVDQIAFEGKRRIAEVADMRNPGWLPLGSEQAKHEAERNDDCEPDHAQWGFGQ